MAESKHTPGPWLAAAKPSSIVGWPIVQPATGRLICNINYVQRTVIDPEVAGDRAFNRESEANARLIAAAPDLLDALHLMTSAFKAFRMKPVGAPGSAVRDEQDQQIAAENAARAAIAAATGSA